ncbi:hypothetical protein WI38_24515 [Burkholderia ubonensis]|uniref:Uncharacterized protein n=1 Tax=Burkholderia ubonensis TaxID=101571 RepID=A0A102LLT5_9BURK|nr:hypothetical protein WI35_33785 [Burkholderia ubonensis]KUZ86054.1 hypothetical protein WI38_24515 [Burkholderia ubonensis]KUZ95864.1 hypothetical protein WI39_13700 [Burkholderia ubonensis]
MLSMSATPLERRQRPRQMPGGGVDLRCLDGVDACGDVVLGGRGRHHRLDAARAQRRLIEPGHERAARREHRDPMRANSGASSLPSGIRTSPAGAAAGGVAATGADACASRECVGPANSATTSAPSHQPAGTRAGQQECIASRAHASRTRATHPGTWLMSQ